MGLAHSSHHTHHHGSPATGPALVFALILTLVFALIEAAAGWWSGSLALFGDAGHMLTDSAALGLATLAAYVSLKPPSGKLSYGLGRIEVLAALVNALLMLLVVIFIGIEAIDRIQSPMPVQGPVVMGVALAGLVINLMIYRMLSGGEHSLNVRGALLHVMGDMLGSVAALVSGIVVYLTNWYPIDPVLSLLICLLILLSSGRLLLDTANILLEGVPAGIDLDAVGTRMAAADGRIKSVHDLHIWTLSSGNVALSAHIVLQDMQVWPALLQKLQKLLLEEYKINHVTLQPETADEVPLVLLR